jgi:hypothetical protein
MRSSPDDRSIELEPGPHEPLRMEAGQQEHRNKDKCRGDERKVKCLGYHISENKVFGHDRLLESYRL